MPISPRPRLARRRTGGAAHRVARGASVTLDCREMAQNFRFEGMTLTVENVERSLGFYSGMLGLAVAWNAAPAFAMLRLGAGTIGLLSVTEARKEGVADSTAAQKQAIHVEFSTDDLDVLYEELKAKGVVFHQPPHDEPWERAMTAFDPDGYAVECAQGKRGENAPR
jgi:catechol 2,3-dioxygenase-like lactoylglutathione lyase family enzyme